MKNNEEKFQISEIKNMLFLSRTKWKIEFKRKNLFCKTIVHKWDIAIIHFHLLYPIPCTLTTSNITSLLVRQKFYTAIFSAIDRSSKFVDWNCFGDEWCLMDTFRLNYFIQLRQVNNDNR